MERQFSRKDVYLLLIMSRWWRERPVEEYERTSYDRFLELGGLDSDSSRYPTLALELAKRILMIVRSYPTEESDEESEVEAGSEGGSESSSEEEG
jgi:hypothetical protein